MKCVLCDGPGPVIDDPEPEIEYKTQTLQEALDKWERENAYVVALEKYVMAMQNCRWNIVTHSDQIQL